MDPTRFDALARALAGAPTRRGLIVGLVAALGLGPNRDVASAGDDKGKGKGKNADNGAGSANQGGGKGSGGRDGG